jgi:hypothetical protein
VQQIKLIAVTGVLTLLIWTMADQLVTDRAEIEVTVELEPAGDTGLIVDTDPPGLRTFQMTLAGPKRIVDQVRKDGLSRVSLPVRDHPNGEYTIDVKRALADYPEQFRGLRIEAVDPPVVTVVVDHLVSTMMPVYAERGDLEYDVPPVVEPTEVEVTISQRALSALAPAERRVSLDLATLLRPKAKGEPLEIPAVLTPRVGGTEVRLRPNTVTVFATLRAQSKTTTIAAVPVHVAASFDVLNQFRIETRDGSTLVTRAITVRGPPEAVDRLVAGETRVTGLIRLTGDLAALPGEYHELEPVFHLPPGVRLAAPVAPVQFRLVPVEPDGGS